MNLRASLLLPLLMVVGCRSTDPVSVSVPLADPTVTISFVGTTDVHGWVEGREEQASDGPIRIGGADVLAGYLANLRRAREGRVILVDAGDMYQGTLISNMFEGEPVVKAFNALGYSAVAIGNHEFDFGPVGEMSVARGSEDPRGALKVNMARAEHPFLAANIRERSTGRRPDWVRPFVLVEMAGLKIGIIGIITPSTPAVTMPSNVVGLEFTDPLEATVAAASELRQSGADFVVVTTHMGGDCPDMRDVHETSSCRVDDEILQFTSEMPPGVVDLIFAGHTHRQVRHVFNGIPVLQGAALGREFSRADVSWDLRSRRATVSLQEHTMICSEVWEGSLSCDPTQANGRPRVRRVYEGSPVTPDAKVASILSPYSEAVAARKAEKLGVFIAAPILHERGESPLANWITDALLHAFPEADAAIINSGGVRSSLLTPGELTFGDIFSVLPFDNFATVVELTGEQLRELMRLGDSGLGGMLQVAGLRKTVDLRKDEALPFHERDRILSLSLASGAPIDPTRMYRLVMNDFLALGGDALGPVMEQLPASQVTFYYDRGPLRDVVASAWREMTGGKPTTIEPEGRITLVGE